MAAKLHWRQAEDITLSTLQCGHCGNLLASDVGYTQAQHADGSCSINRAYFARSNLYSAKEKLKTVSVRCGALLT